MSFPNNGTVRDIWASLYLFIISFWNDS